MTSQARRLRIDLAYEGTEFAGWQVQPGLRTVQGVIEETLGRLQGGSPVRVRGAGRTDAGVHARGQVADAELAVRLDDAALCRALSGMLPEDVRPLRVTSVDSGFHSRRDALSKCYRYTLDRTASGDPFRARYSWHYPGELDQEALADGLARLPGRRDWSGFAGAACAVQDRMRRITVATYHEPSPAEGVFTFCADGFLNHMVRNLVGTLLEIARGRYPPGRIDEILEAGDRTLAGPTAPARGLCLEQVLYPDQKGDVFQTPFSGTG